jgi:GMP synthase-like glutamine amidotransferase
VRPARSLKTEEGLRPDILIADRGGWTKAGHGLNRLTRDLASRVGNGTPFYETSVAVAPCPDDGLAGTRVLVVQHSKDTPGGDFVKELERLGAVVSTLRPVEGEALPPTHEAFGAMVVLGGPQHSFDDQSSPHFQPLMQLMRDCDAAGKPVAGICLGSQLLARAHGAATWTMEALEFGFVAHEVTRDGRADPVIGPAGPLPRLMEFHEDSFDLPPGATLLVSGRACPHQCFKVGRASYGFQFHLEADAAVIDHWVELFRRRAMEAYADYGRLYDAAFFETLAAELPFLHAAAEAFCRRVAGNWFALARRQAAAGS